MRVISAKWGDKSSAFHQVGLTNVRGRAFFLAQGGKYRLEKLQMDSLVARNARHAYIMHALHVLRVTYW